MRVQGVILDWAGTTIDYGCFAPVAVFVDIFKNRGISITMEEAREPMGLLKWDHVQAICRMERVAGLWKTAFGQEPTEADVHSLYADFEQQIFEVLKEYTDPIPGAIEQVARLRRQGIKIGSTTGYTMEMMRTVTAEAKRKGYVPDCLVTPDEVPQGRPYPWMIYENAIRLGIYPMKHIVKVGDTLSDIREGVNAGAWTVGILKGGSELGMSEAEVNACDPDELAVKLAEVERRYRKAGVHYVIESIGALDPVIEEVNARLQAGDHPST
ncbi:phosphonoacetaldehyde hydrolase [Paenibacillus filicis]|uniref:Phosphonoacetaldehyde hydrolase n=1 Tax=Paenibacillus gyeongsangnamensis TaxID=3388067 RepID=A0ABT4QG05_9BACL|nr:phosphonoacetaldehyde hydrolase [Paenibacillus filicis]MCZ8515737.1 phosphonoacetaldehyde hydrolase [Paenibacillus filicis]